jgi:hydrophobic/amphiphilic exporter-1 (mainly G- bacteria), HAE1 family
VATTLVLLAVFTPTMMVGGITGRLYQQFAITLSVATMFSTTNALTLSPALCALLLRPSSQKRGRIFGMFDRLLKTTTSDYAEAVSAITRRIGIALLVFAGVSVLSVLGFRTLPTGFLPDEDEGSIFVNVRLPDGATLMRTEAVMKQIDTILKETPGVAEYITVAGFSLLDGMSPNGGICFSNMDPWSKRKDPLLHVKKIAERLQGRFFVEIPDAFCLALTPPSIMGLGMAGGFEVQIQDRGGAGLDALAEFGENLVFQTMADPKITRLNSTLRMTVPQFYVDIDRVKVKTMDVPLLSVFNTLQTYLGSSYVNDFNLFGRTFKVIAQAEPEFRTTVEDIGRLEVRNRSGQMLPIKSFATIRDTIGPRTVTHHNLYPSTTITGIAKPGVSSGQAIEHVRTLLEEKLPPSLGYEWSGISLQEIESGKSTVFLFVLSSVFAYLFLSAQYESWSIPFAIILAIPLGLLGAGGFTLLRGMDNNIYTQMGIVLLIGIVCKTAILLVEFAKQLHEEGYSVVDAAVMAARLRFRPILMTALTTALGTLPLVIATGAGAQARQALGTSVFGGMIAATVVGVFMIPVFYVTVQRTKEKAVDLEHKLEDATHHWPG